MKLHDRIMAMSEHGVDEEWPDYDSAIRGAAQIATEADALMREMHSALEEYEACHNLAKTGLIAPDWDSARIQAQTAIKHYQEYAE